MNHRTRTHVVGMILAVLACLGLVMPAQAQGYEDAIYAACARYGCDGGQLVRVAYCESNMNPNAVGPHGERGLLASDLFPHLRAVLNGRDQE